MLFSHAASGLRKVWTDLRIVSSDTGRPSVDYLSDRVNIKQISDLQLSNVLFDAGEQEPAMYARPALLVVLLLSVSRLAVQQSAVSDDYVPQNTDDGKVKSLPVDLVTLRGAINAVKRHIGKFVRIGRSSSNDASTLRLDDALWKLYYAPRLPQRLLGSRRRRSDLYDTVDTTTLYDIQPLKPDRSALPLQDTVVDSSVVNKVLGESKKKNRGIRFVRIGKENGQMPVNAESNEGTNIFRRSLENRFVRIGK